MLRNLANKVCFTDTFKNFINLKTLFADTFYLRQMFTSSTNTSSVDAKSVGLKEKHPFPDEVHQKAFGVYC